MCREARIGGDFEGARSAALGDLWGGGVVPEIAVGHSNVAVAGDIDRIHEIVINHNAVDIALAEPERAEDHRQPDGGENGDAAGSVPAELERRSPRQPYGDSEKGLKHPHDVTR